MAELRLQKRFTGSFPRAASALVVARPAAIDLDLGTVVQFDDANPEQVSPQTAAAPEKFVGVVIGRERGTSPNYDAGPAAGDLALIAVPPCEVEVRVQESLAAGLSLTFGTSAGQAQGWQMGSDLMGVLLEASSPGNRAAAFLHAIGQPLPFGGTRLARTAAAAIELGALVGYDGTTPSEVSALPDSAPERFAGVCIGRQVGSSFDPTNGPASSETAVLALPRSEVPVRLQDTLSAGTVIKPGSTDGRVQAWLPTNDEVGVLIAGGSAGDLALAYVHDVLRLIS